MSAFSVSFWMLIWIAATPAPDTIEKELFFADKFPSRIECQSVATQIAEKIKEQPMTYSRFVCVPVPGERQ